MSKEGRQVLRRREKNKPGMTPQNWRLKKGRQVFKENNRGVTPSVAGPGVTHPSDATGFSVAGPTVWNSLPESVRSAETLASSAS